MPIDSRNCKLMNKLKVHTNLSDDLSSRKQNSRIKLIFPPHVAIPPCVLRNISVVPHKIRQ